MHLVIAKVDQVFFDGEADSLTVQGSEGELTVLPHHEPLITTLKAGAAVVRHGGQEQKFEISGGLLEVHQNGVTVIL